MMTINKLETVSNIVKENPLSSKVFYKHGIDFCCGGKIPLEESCQKHDVPVDSVVNDLNMLFSVESPNQKKYNFTSAKEVIDEIIEDYHKPLYESLPIIKQLCTKVNSVHGSTHSELNELYITFQQLETDLIQHMYKEEEILFPMILNLEKNQNSNFHHNSVSGPINQMEFEHDEVSGFLTKIKKLTSNFTPPEDACNSYRGLYAMLKELEFELYQHIYLENNILHPMALNLENNE